MRFLCLLGCCATVVFAMVSAGRAGDSLPDNAPDATPEQAIDHFVDARLQTSGVSPSPLADDAILLRRTMLDLVGRIPTAEEARTYIACQDTDKRVRLVEQLMASPAFVRQQAAEFDALLMDGTRSSIREYLARALQHNRSWDQMFRDMIIGEPDDAKQQGAIRFVATRAKDQDRLTVDTSVLFFGVNVSCAKCHDHPLVPDWKQDHYYGMLSFFNRTFDVGEYLGERDYGTVSFKTVKGETRDAKLMFLSGQEVDEVPSPEPDEGERKEEKRRIDELRKNKEPPSPPGYSRRATLVDAALHDGKEQFFSRAIVNHLWNRLFGRGLVMPVDQMHSENAPSHPELLAWLARDFETHGYDLRRLVRGMVLSRTYGRSSQWDQPERRPADDLYAVAVARPLKTWQYGTLLKLAATSPEQFPASMNAEEREQRIKSLEDAGRGLVGSGELPGADFQVGVDEALLFSNSAKIGQELLGVGPETLVGKLAEISDPRQAAEVAVWNVFTRKPVEQELQALTEYLERREDRPAEARRQMVWALLTSSECRFNY